MRTNDAELHAALVDFETTYSTYAEVQDRLEHYWCLRWLLQEGVTETTATVIREGVVRFDHLPLVVRLPGCPSRRPRRGSGSPSAAIDLIAATLECRYAGN